MRFLASNMSFRVSSWCSGGPHFSVFHDVMLYLRLWRTSRLLLGQESEAIFAKTTCNILCFLVSSSLPPPDSRLFV